MALTKCKECGNSISTKAAACPSCGARAAQKTKLSTWIVAGFFAFLLYQCASFNSYREKSAANPVKIAEPRTQVGTAETNPVTAAAPSKADIEQKAAEKAYGLVRKSEAELKEQRFQKSLSIAMALKKSVNDPSSFELIRADIMKDETSCFVYRAKNAFNALIVDKTAIGPDYKIRDWNRFCAGKSGDNITHIRAVL